MVGSALGLSVDALDVDRLTALLLASPAASAPARIGTADVEAIEQATAMLRRWDYRCGSGLCRPVAVAQLRSAPSCNPRHHPGRRQVRSQTEAALAMA